MPRPSLIERRISRFMRKPLSVRSAVSVIVVATTIVVLVSALLMKLLDHSEYPHFGRGLWWAMQTVPTVGYGDVTPANPSGRIVASVVMLWGIAFVATLTALITTTFVTRASREREQAVGKEDSSDARLDDLAARLDRIEKLLTPPAG